MGELVKVEKIEDITQEYMGTPIGRLIEYQNLGRDFETYAKAEVLVGMCMDNRKHLRIPENFAYIIRSGGGNMRNSEFKVSYAISIGGVKCIALLAHNHCGMVGLHERKDEFIEGLVKNAGWERELAEKHFEHYAPLFEIGDEIDFVLNEAKRLSGKYPNVLIAPLFYDVEDNKLYIIKE